MLNKSKCIKIGLISVLIVLVVVCALALSKKGGKAEFRKNTDSKVISTWDMDMTPKDKVIASWDSFVKKDDMMYIYDGGMIFKWDYKSVDYRPACDNPTCDHKGDSCSAFFGDKYECVKYYNNHWIFVEKDDNKRYYLGYCDFNGQNRKRVLDISDDIQGLNHMIYIDIDDEKLYLNYNSVINCCNDDGEWETKIRFCVIEYDVSLIGKDMSYSREILLCDDDKTWHLISLCDGRLVTDVPGTNKEIGVFGDCRLYYMNDMSFETIKGSYYVQLLSQGRYVSQENDGLMLVDNDKKIRLDDGGWGVAFCDDKRIYAINMYERQMKYSEDKSVMPSAEVKVYDYEGNVVDHIYLPKDYSIIGSIAAYDGRYYLTNIDKYGGQFFYVYDTQNPDKGWKKINRGY
ncbi:MAG TPA: hypothetical protein DCX21_02330 [Eubacterium sp.]|nr:hypothetical protein [Eubacterium sp.]